MKLKWKIILGIISLLIVVRLLLPWFVTQYVNRVLADIPGYKGSISDVDLHLYRGAYRIYDLSLFKVDGNQQIPFVNIAATDLSIEWGALFHGSVVGEVVFEKPVLNFIGGGSEKQDQSGKDVDWTEPIKKLVPFQINRLEINRGKITFNDFSKKPKVDLNLDSVSLLATNLNNAKHQDAPLPSKVKARAVSIGHGQLQLDMGINVLKPIPDLDMDMKFERVNMPALNDFFKAYSKVDIEKGTFNLYAEMEINKGNINGYVKPVMQDVKIVSFKKDKENPVGLVWESFVAALAEAFKNHPEDQLATKVPFTGKVDNVNTPVLPTIWNVFRNAFFEAFTRSTDNTIQFGGKGEEKKRS